MFEFNSNRCLVRETIVIIDFQGHPIRFDQLGVYDEVIAQERCMRLDLQVQTQDSRGAWRHVASTELGEESLHWRSGLKAGAKQLQDLQVKASDPHYFKGSNKRSWLALRHHLHNKHRLQCRGPPTRITSLRIRREAVCLRPPVRDWQFAFRVWPRRSYLQECQP